MQKLFLLALAGAAGTLARYGFGGLVQRLSGGMFPWGTFAVNVTGCLAAGFLWSLAESRLFLAGELRAVVFIGFMGAFTTFSSLMLETNALLRDGGTFAALANIAGSTLAGFAALWIGLTLGKLL